MHALSPSLEMGIADKLGIGKSSTFVAKVTVHELSQGEPLLFAPSPKLPLGSC